MSAKNEDAINQPALSRVPAPQRVTLKQVAARAGVSAAAASAAITGRRGTTRVSTETADMIRRVAAELGYEPNILGRAAARQRTETLALALPYAAAFWDCNPFNQAIVHGATEAAARLGCHLLLTTRRNHGWQQWDAATLMAAPADGVLVVAPAVGSPLLSTLAEAGFPAVAAVCDPIDCPLPSVNADDAEGARAAVTYLIRLGHRRIGWLSGANDLGTTYSRRDGYLAALSAAGLDAPPSLIAHGSADEPGGFRAAVELLARSPRPTALFAFNDLMARGAIDAAWQRGLAVPEQLSIVGFDDADFAASLNPPLTTVRYSMRAIAARGLEALVQVVQDSFYPLRTSQGAASRRTAQTVAPSYTLPTQLVVRLSCAPPAPDSAP
jgi:DNA-binding LacI/PurR family transcriptional regulator